MGLSRKLGGAGTTSRALDLPSHHVDYTWSTQSYTIRDILTKFRLPCVVQCSGDAGTVLWADFRFDMRQPLLLHAARTVRKMHARSLQVLEPSGQLQEFGPPLAIPEDYDGWFFPVGRSQDPTDLPRHTRVEGVAGSPARQFLVTTTLPAFRPAKGPGSGPGGAKHVQHEVSIGEVLTKAGVTKGDPSVPPASPTALMQRSRQSLRCVDENQHEVVIPFHHRALLFDVAESYGPPQSSGVSLGAADLQATVPSSPGVVHTNTIVTVGNKYLPRIFRHVLGELPALAQTFTGLLRCYSVFTEETVMAAAMCGSNLYSMTQESSCLELATDSSAKFKIALNASELKKTHQYALALRTCEEQAPSYVRAIKTSFTVQPVLSELEDVDMSLYDTSQARSEERPHVGSTKTQSSVPTSSVHSVAQNENSFTDALRLGGEHEAIDPRSDATEQTDDVGDNESVMTDDVPNSVMDTASQSDATDFLYSDVSDAGEVEANSEFDISWSLLKRARSFSGSASSLTDDSATSSTATDSESEDSIVAQESLDSSVSHDSTLTKETTSTASEDTVVFRASAPSPVYANVPKKLSVYNSEQNGDGSRVTEPPEVPSIVQPNSIYVNSVDSTVLGNSVGSTMFDNSVRSVWNITPTVDGQHAGNVNYTTDERGSVLVPGDDSRGAANPIWWGDVLDSAHQDISQTSVDSRQRDSAVDQCGFSSLERSLENMEKPVAKHHPQLSLAPSFDGPTGLQSTHASHSLLSSKLSVRSEGSAQDLVIQRLERALNEASDFLNSTGPPSPPPALPPRKGKPFGVNIHQVGSSGQDGAGSKNSLQVAPPCDVNVESGLSGTSPTVGSSLMAHTPLSASASNQSLPDHHTFPPLDHQALSLHDDKTQSNISSDFGYEHSNQGKTAHWQSVSHLDSDQGAHREDAQQEEGQIDLDFVKTLGDRLMAVSRKSSLPKYQRLQPDVLMQSEDQEESRQFRKKQHRAVPRSMAQDGAVSHDGEEADAANSRFTGNWDCVESRQREAILTDLDLLEEEVV
ncbi:uncharacterized protein LOC143294727 [Babylonia areolata]|uniref:uncharacterized protein LOC143294727 n=1 Tax=Babylonia areolata TaxID=304850 RepID=UPI003FD0F3D8